MFLHYGCIIDTVKMNCVVKINQINYAEPWLIQNRIPDPKSIKMHLIGVTDPVHALLPLSEFCESTGFVLLDTWEHKEDKNMGRPRAINLHNINLIRPYTMNRGIKNWVMYFQGVGGRSQDLHLSATTAAHIVEIISKM